MYARTIGSINSHGRLHAKSLRVGDFYIVGSTNWTVSSLCTVERDVIIRLSPEGRSRLEAREDELYIEWREVRWTDS